MAAVNPARRYTSPLRAEQARLTRTAVLASARRLFLADGYALTTIGSVAGDAGVSVETVYKAFGSKPGLVRAICADALAGDGPIPAEERSNAMQRREPDPVRIVRGWADMTREVSPRIAPLLLLMRAAAAADDEMAQLLRQLEDQRLERMTRNARTLADGGHLREGVTLRAAAETLWTYSSPELYELLVLKRAWPLERYGQFIGDALTAALL
ncbi:MAG: TetR/AcrR family transcriptional regulator [Actinomycetota bacterium]|nr:TetR/AcrR family transcriptional regulator [Actinomycetota bacterium]